MQEGKSIDRLATCSCWESWHEHTAREYGPCSPTTQTCLEHPDRVCLLADGHDGPHRFVALADDVAVGLPEDDPELNRALDDKLDAGIDESVERTIQGWMAAGGFLDPPYLGLVVKALIKADKRDLAATLIQICGLYEQGRVRSGFVALIFASKDPDTFAPAPREAPVLTLTEGGGA